MTQAQPQGGFLSNLAFNIIIPVLILMKFSGPEHLGPAWGVVIALAFPVSYGLYDLNRTRKINGFSILGIVSVILTGGISLLELDPQYIAIKEAAVPGLIAVAVLVSHFTRFPLIKKLLMNDKVIDTDKLYAAIAERNTQGAFNRVLKIATFLVAGAFFLSAVLNYVLARLIVVSPAGTVEFNNELGRMTALSFPVIALPTMLVMFTAIFYLFYQMKKLTGSSVENFLRNQPTAKDEQSTDGPT